MQNTLGCGIAGRSDGRVACLRRMIWYRADTLCAYTLTCAGSACEADTGGLDSSSPCTTRSPSKAMSRQTSRSAGTGQLAVGQVSSSLLCADGWCV